MGNTPTILQGIMDGAIPGVTDGAPKPDVQVPMRRPEELTPVADSTVGNLPTVDPIHIMSMAFMGSAAENQKKYEAEAAGQPSPDAAPGTFRSKLAGALNAVSGGLGDAAAAQGGPNDKYSGWLGAVGRVLNARTARKADEQKTAFDQQERLKNDRMNLAMNNINMRQHVLAVHKLEKEDRDSDAATAEKLTGFYRDNYDVQDKVNQSQLNKLASDKNWLATHTASITGYEKLLDADGNPRKDANGFDIESPLYSTINLGKDDFKQQHTVPAGQAKIWSDAGLKDVPAGTVMPVTAAKALDTQAQRYGTTLGILNHAKVQPLPNDVKDQMVDALHDTEVQHSVAMNPGSPLGGLYAAADNMSQHIQQAQTQLAAAQKAGDQNAVQKLTQDIQSHQDIAAKLDTTITQGFTPQERAAYQKQADADRKETQIEKHQEDVEAETARHNRAMEAIDRAKSPTATPDEVNHAGQLLADSMEDPSQLSKRGKDYQPTLNAADNYSWQTYGKPFNIAQQTIDYKYAQKAQDNLKYLNSLTGGPGVQGGGNLGELVKQSNKITRTEFPPLNDVAAWARLKTGDPAIAAYQTVVVEVADQVAKILQGGGSGNGTSDAKLKQAQEMFDKSFTKDQIMAIANELNPLLANRQKALIGNNRYLQNQFYGPSGVTVTMIKDGHKVEVPQRNVEEAKNRGGHIQTQAEYRTSLPSSAPQQ